MKEFLLKQRSIPKTLHDIFGEYQSLGVIASVIGFGILATAAGAYPDMFAGLRLLSLRGHTRLSALC